MVSSFTHIVYSIVYFVYSVWFIRWIVHTFCLASPDVVVIHDAVRPFVDEETLRQVALAAREYGVSVGNWGHAGVDIESVVICPQNMCGAVQIYRTEFVVAPKTLAYLNSSVGLHIYVLQFSKYVRGNHYLYIDIKY